MDSKPAVEIEEVRSILTPAPGVSIYQAIDDANLSGYDEIIYHFDHVEIVWYRRK